jgi:hypothetical protein
MRTKSINLLSSINLICTRKLNTKRFVPVRVELLGEKRRLERRFLMFLLVTLPKATHVIMTVMTHDHHTFR